MRRSLLDRFWAKVDKNGPVPAHRLDLGPCWLWVAACDRDGYGVFGKKRAHRVVFELEVVLLLPGQQALHHCDNPGCVRPSHLWAGTHLENHQDKARKGRAPTPWLVLYPEEAACGEEHPNALLTEEAVKDIRKNYMPRKATLDFFARKYGVAKSTVHLALSGGSWQGVAP